MNVWVQFKDIIFEILRFLQGILGNWGLAIIALTVLFRLALMPLTIKQTKSMYEMQRIQPKLKELQAKYKDDKQKLQEETMKFYQENKVNPFGGCLPLILQMPIFIALFQVLGGTAKKPGIMLQYFDQLPAAAKEAAVRFYFLLPDITKTPQTVFKLQGLLAAVPYLVLVVLFGLSIWLPQQLMPGERQQKMIGTYMAVLFLWFGWISPAGVLLYWVTSSFIGVAQQQIQLRYLKEHAAHEEELAAQERAAAKAAKSAKSGRQTAKPLPDTVSGEGGAPKQSPPGGGQRSGKRKRS
jgi:YidC/Oxa1 family membrane protein insertase